MSLLLLPIILSSLYVNIYIIIVADVLPPNGRHAIGNRHTFIVLMC